MKGKHVGNIATPKCVALSAAFAAAIALGGCSGLNAGSSVDAEAIQAQGPVVVVKNKSLTAKGNKIQEVDDKGCISDTVYEGSDKVDNLVADDSNVYFTEGKDIVKLEPKDDKADVIHEGASDDSAPHDINISEDKVYFTDDETIKEVDKDGKNEKDVLEGKDDVKDQLNLDGVIILDNKAYFTGQGNNKNTGAIYEVDLQTGEEQFLYSPEHCSALLDLTVLPDHVYFIQEDTYEGPCHIYEMDRESGSQLNELAVSQSSDEYFNHLVIFDGKAYFTKSNDKGISICSLNLSDKKISEVAKLADSTDFVVDDLGIADNKLYYTSLGKLFYVDANSTNQKPESIKTQSVLYNASGNVANGGNVVVGENNKIYYVSTKVIEKKDIDYDLKATIFETSLDDISKASQICSANVRDYSKFSGLELMGDKPVMLQVNQKDSISNISLVDKNPFSNASSYIVIPEGSEAQVNDLVITDYVITKDCIYYALSSYALDMDIAGIYKFDLTTCDTEQVVKLNGISQLIDVDGVIYAVTQDWVNTSSAIYKVEGNSAKKLYASDMAYIYFVVPYESEFYFAEQKENEFTIKKCDLEALKVETMYQGRDHIQGLNTYGGRLYIAFDEGAMLDDLKTSMKSLTLDDFEESDVLIDQLGDGNFGIASVDGGLVVQGKESLLYYDVEHDSVIPMTSCKAE